MAKEKKKQLPHLPDFDFEAFQKEALKQLKAGKPITGKDGVLTPLIKRIVESALKGELDAHLEAEPEEGGTGLEGELRLAEPGVAPAEVAALVGFDQSASDLFELSVAIMGYYDPRLGSFVNPWIPPSSGTPIYLADDAWLTSVLSRKQAHTPGSALIGSLLTRPDGAAGVERLRLPVEHRMLERLAADAGVYLFALELARTIVRRAERRVVTLAKEAGVELTPAGATHPYGKDPEDRTIRIAPTFPDLKEVEQAAEGVAACVLLAVAEKHAAQPGSSATAS